MQTTTLPSNLSLIMPRCGSFENVISIVAVGFSRYGPRLRKSVAPSCVVRRKLWALGLTIIARIHGSLKRSPTRTTLMGLVEGSTDGRSSLRFTATVGSGGAAGAARGIPSAGTALAVGIEAGCAA